MQIIDSAVSETPTSTTCGGTLYAVQPTDDFYSIPRSQSVSTDQLLNSNNLPYNATEFPESGSLCVENKCTTHVVAANETCKSIAAAAEISEVQLRAWNLNINDLCRYEYCIRQPTSESPYGLTIPQQSRAVLG